ncbi:MAG TPA: hypothetical protein VJH90_03365 [archaeon]|nr:hypothetical protein [archaeon]
MKNYRGLSEEESAARRELLREAEGKPTYTQKDRTAAERIPNSAPKKHRRRERSRYLLDEEKQKEIEHYQVMGCAGSEISRLAGVRTTTVYRYMLRNLVIQAEQLGFFISELDDGNWLIPDSITDGSNIYLNMLEKMKDGKRMRRLDISRKLGYPRRNIIKEIGVLEFMELIERTYEHPERDCRDRYAITDRAKKAVDLILSIREDMKKFNSGFRQRLEASQRPSSLQQAQTS